VLLPSYVATAVGTVGEVVLFNKDFTVLASALRKADLLDAVSTTDDITVFAPDNAAFVAAGLTSLDGIDDETLSSVLLYHVLGARVKSNELPASGIAATLNGSNIYLGYLFNQRVLINGLTEIKAVDIEKSNGVIHVIDRTLVPPAPNVVEIALALADQGDDSEFTVLTSLLASEDFADITQAIIDAENITVFAPTDAAFEAIEDVVGGLTPEQISTVLTYHAAGARVFSYNLVDGQEVIMLNGQTVKITKLPGEAVFIEDKSGGEDALVIEANVHGSNGVIHVIDKVLIPNL
jgi:transforming growth factor-beta-induced protein